jgi:hypothetical protein
MRNEAGLKPEAPDRAGWFRDLIQTIEPCRFSVLSVLLGIALFNDQAQDLLCSVADHLPHRSARLVQLFVAMYVWGHSNWHFARVMLYFRFPDTPPFTARMAAMARWVPRVLGVLPMLTFAAACLVARSSLDGSGSTTLGLLAAGSFWLAVAFFAAVTKRRAAWQAIMKTPLPLERNANARLSALKPLTRIYLVIWSTVGLGLVTAFWLAAPSVAPSFGPLALLFLTAAFWVPAGSALVYVGSRWRKPILTGVLAVAIVFSCTTDNHLIRSVEGTPSLQSADSAFRDWLAALPPAKGASSPPAFFVAAEGGGIRAAYWTAKVLGGLQDQYTDFAPHLFAVSSVSGGSLGAVVFASLLAEDPAAARPKNWFADQAKGVLGEDFLSPVLASMLYPDLVTDFIPWSAGFSQTADRALSLERSWERSWRAHVGSDRLARPFLSLWSTPGRIPHLLLNTTCVETGQRFVVSDLRAAPRLGDVKDALDLIGKDVPLSTAAHLSARFAYVSPAGLIPRPSDQCGHLVDGGYFENSGTATLLDLLQRLPDGIVAPDGTKRSYLPVVISISNDPDRARPAGHLRFLSEVRAPIGTFFATRGARGRSAEVALAKYVTGDIELAQRQNRCSVIGDDKNGYFVEFALSRKCAAAMATAPATPVPLGWALSGAAQAQMDCQWEASDCKQARETIGKLLAH